MALRACNNPRIHGDALSRAVARLVAKYAKAEYASYRGKQRATMTVRASPLTPGTRWG